MQPYRPESMRRHNERLVLSLLRRDGALPRSVLAQRSGLSAQAMTNIVRDLIARGLIAAEGPVRGRVGQPTVPLRLAPRGAFFLGLKIGRGSLQLVLMDFAGTVLDSRTAREAEVIADPAAVVDFARSAAAEMTAATLSPDEAALVAGLGIAVPFLMWDWGAQYAGWQGSDLRAALEAATGLPTWLENDASSACAAELVFGRRDLPRDFLYAYVGHFAGGGLVLDGRLSLGPRGNAGALGSTPVPGPDGRAVQLLERASLANLEAGLGRPLPDYAEDGPRPDWLPDDLRRDWLAQAGAALAFAALSATTILDLEAVVIDGAFPPDLRDDLAAAVEGALTRLPGAGVKLPRVLAGSLGPRARAMGAAALPLAELFMLDVVAASPATAG